MFNKNIKHVAVICALFCTLPNISCALDKEDFIKFLVNSSYPESKVEINKKESKDEVEDEISQNEEKDSQVKKENNPPSEGDYIKFYVGEENTPNINTSSSIELASNKDYKEDLRVSKENPSILLYHTHSSETYSESPAGNYHSQDKPNSVMAVGSLLTDELSKKGWGVIHTTKYHDLDYNASYQTSLKTIQNLKDKYSSVNIAIDIHRDARNIPDLESKKSQHKIFTTTINGESVAKIFFVVGKKNTNFNELKASAEDITKFAEKKYPGITMPVVIKEFGKYNQFVAENHMLVEIGSNANSIKESKATTKYLANILDEYYSQHK